MKKLWKENRILVVLLAIILVCFITIICVAFTFFYSTKATKYGNRLDNIENYPITDEFKNSYMDSIKENTSVSDIKLNLIGRILYVDITFNDTITLDKAKALCESSLSSFSDDLLEYYDIEFVLKGNDFTIMGAKNAINDYVSWNNNTVVEDESNEEA